MCGLMFYSRRLALCVLFGFARCGRSARGANEIFMKSLITNPICHSVYVPRVRVAALEQRKVWLKGRPDIHCIFTSALDSCGLSWVLKKPFFWKIQFRAPISGFFCRRFPALRRGSRVLQIKVI